MEPLTNGCSAWVLSQWLNSHAAANNCCNIHDATLSVTRDWAVFWSGNEAFRDCLSQWNGVVGFIAWLVVCSPLGAWVFFTSRKAIAKVAALLDTGPVT